MMKIILPRPSALLITPILLFSGFAAAQVSREFTSVADAHVDSTQTTSNFGFLDDVFTANVGTTGSAEAFIRFDLTAIPRTARVLGAVLTYQVTEASSTAPNISFGLVGKQWKEKGQGSITFETRPKIDRELQEHAPTVGRHRVVANPELRAAIQGWIRDPSANAGLRLLVTEGGTTAKARFASIVAREHAVNGRTAPTLRIDFVHVQIATENLNSGNVGRDYLSRIEARTQGVTAVQWRVLDTLPAGLDHRVVDGELEFFGRPVRVGDEVIRVEARDPVTGVAHVRGLRLRVFPAEGEVRIRKGSELEGKSFDGANPQPLTALAIRVANETGDTVALQSLAFFVAGSADNVRDLASIELFEDVDADGIVDPSDLRVAGPIPFVSDHDSTILNLANARLLRGTTRQFLVVVTPRIDCPQGREFAITMLHGDEQRGRMEGSDAPARIFLNGRIEGPAFVAGQPEAFDGDANGDGVIDCLDAQILARRLGSAANGSADPDGDGVIERTDVELVQDFVLGRPVVTRLEFRRGSQGSTLGILVLEGFGLGADAATTECSVDGSFRSPNLATARVAVLRLGSLPAGDHRLRVTLGPATSREYTFLVR